MVWVKGVVEHCGKEVVPYAYDVVLKEISLTQMYKINSLYSEEELRTADDPSEVDSLEDCSDENNVDDGRRGMSAAEHMALHGLQV